MMPQSNNTILVTGGAGFIGSAVVRLLINETHCNVVNVDKLTYAGNPESLRSIAADPRYQLEQSDICDHAEMTRIFRQYHPDAVLHLAAESHVDRSIEGPGEFIQTNIIGTYTLLEVARQYWQQCAGDKKTGFRFHHVSTDEVYGDLADSSPLPSAGEGAGERGQEQCRFTETTAYAPSSPYSASKASSDHLVHAWHRTYGLPVLLTNCSNNYGPCQFPEKLIPLMTLNAVEGKPLPVYGRGDNIRDWLYVDDHAKALWHVLTHGDIGRTYNIGGRSERTNLQVVHTICSILDELVPNTPLSNAGERSRDRGQSHTNLIQFVTDRPGHDRHYAIDDTRLATELNWHPQQTFESGLRKTIQWYLDNPEWVEHVRTGEYRQWLQTNYASRKAMT